MRPITRLVAVSKLVTLVAFACTPRETPSVGVRQAPPSPTPVVATPTLPTPGAAASAGSMAHSPTVEARPIFGAPIALGRLTVYPVTLPIGAQDDPGPLILLDEALERGLAEVRELGAEGAEAGEPNQAPQSRRRNVSTINLFDDRNNSAAGQVDGAADPAPPEPVQVVQVRGEPQEQVQQLIGGGGGATVNTLVIENKSDRPIFVLAGTVVKGGKQDRQIAQDFVVDAKTTVPVDAFCVEQGRWDATREGEDTGGRFAAVHTLATSKVRAAGQYAKDQQAVWHNVAETNKAHAKEASSGTLLATLGDPEVQARLDALAGKIHGALSGASPKTELVGLAWAIDGRIQGVRHFAHTRVWELVGQKLSRTIAVDALTAEAGREAMSPSPAPPTVAELEAFVAELASAAESRHETRAANDNVFKESERAWSSTTVLKASGGKKARAIAWDYLVK